MESHSILIHSKTSPLCVSFTSFTKPSVRHFNKHLRFTPINNSPRQFITQKNLSFLKKPLLSRPLKLSISEATTNPDPENPILIKPLRNLSFDSVKAILFQIRPYDVAKWSAVLSIAVAAAKWTAKGIVNPFFWTYFSWSWVFWPWIVAISVGVYGLYCLRKHFLGEATGFQQLAVVTSAFFWLTLVPPAHFNGFIQGWPYVFFFAYHYFFFFNVTVRKRLYGDYNARPHDPKWDINLPDHKTLIFSIGIMAGHWLAAFEGPELHRIPGGFNNVAVWALIVVSLLTQYNSTLYLANYSEKVVVPTAVVQFGPYRWVRHPIYASTMLLFVTYCVALRSPFSALFVVGVCLWYYDQKAKLEEGLMVETFRDGYVEYAEKVKYKFIPFVY